MRRIELRVDVLERDILRGVRETSEADAQRIPVDLGVIPWFEDERPLQGLAAFLDWRANGRLSSLARSTWCAGERGESVLLPWDRGLPIRRLLLIGLGRQAAFDSEMVHSSVQRIVSVVDGLNPEDVLFAMPGAVTERELVELWFAALATAVERLSVRPRVERASPPSDLLHVEREDVGPRVLETDGGSGDAPVAELHPSRERWWVVTQDRHVARLRRLLDGPPRAAES